MAREMAASFDFCGLLEEFFGKKVRNRGIEGDPRKPRPEDFITARCLNG